MISLGMLLIGGLETLDQYLVTMIFQARARGQEDFQPDVFIVRKDDRTSNLINRNPGRREFASIIRTLGRSRAEAPKTDVTKTCRLFELELGHFAAGDPMIVLPFPGVRKIVASGTGAQLFHFREIDAVRLRNFLDFPFSLASGSVLQRAENMWLRDFLGFDGIPASNSVFDVARDSISDSDRVCWNLARSVFLVQIRVFPKPGIPLRVQFSLQVGPREEAIPKALVIGLDFLLQGDGNEDEDSRLMDALNTSECPVVLAGQKNAEPRSSVKIRTDHGQEAVGDALGTRVGEGRAAETLPNVKFQLPRTRLGFINTGSVISKGFLDGLPLFQERLDGKSLAPSFSLAVAVLALDARENAAFPGRFWTAMETELERIRGLRETGAYTGGFQLPDRFIPTTPEGVMKIWFFGSTTSEKGSGQAFPSASFFECFDGEMVDFLEKRVGSESTREILRKGRWITSANKVYSGKACLIGPFEMGDMDFYDCPLNLATPFAVQERMIAGVEVNANAVQTILGKPFLKPPRTWHTVSSTLVATLVLGLMLGRLGAFAGGFLTLAFLAGAVGLGDFCYHSAGQVFRFSALLISFFLTWSFGTLDSYLRQKQRAQATKAMFQRFVSADVVQHMIEHPEAVKPGGQKVPLTIFFSDVAGFTSISEALSPENLVILLNEYLGAMTRLLFKHGGTLDKFIGDAVMAFWNHPRPQQDHAVRACRYALEMRERITELQKDWASRGLPRISARAGINTADVIVGYMGAEEVQMNFTCMGDGVNLASRLEGANKEYGSDIMVSGSTYELAKDFFTLRFLDFLAVKGKKEPVKVYQLISEKGREPPEWAELSALYSSALDLHLARKWDEAIGTFSLILERWPGDGPAKTYLGRCQEYKSSPPPEDWNGSYHLTHK